MEEKKKEEAEAPPAPTAIPNRNESAIASAGLGILGKPTEGTPAGRDSMAVGRGSKATGLEEGKKRTSDLAKNGQNILR